MRNLQFATRSMGVVETSPSVPQGGGVRRRINKTESTLDRLNWAQARGLDARLHLLEMHRTQMYAKYVRMAPPRLAGILPMPAETNT
jgi:hypothetical protein